jgi:hypothetical protein
MKRFGRSILCTVAIVMALTAWGGARPAHASLVMYEIIFHPVLGPAPTGFIQVNVTCTVCFLPASAVTFFDVKDPGLSGSPEWTLVDPRTAFTVFVGPSDVLGITYVNGHDTLSPPLVPTLDRLNMAGVGGITDVYSITTNLFGPLGAGSYELHPVPEAPLGAASMALAGLAAAWLALRRRRRALAG